MTNLKKILPNFLLSLYFFLPTALGHKIYVFMRLGGADSLKLEKYIALFIGIFIFSFIKQRSLRFFAMGFVLLLSFAQFTHLEFYGLPIYPAEFFLLFTQGGEIWATVSDDYSIFFLPVLLSIVPSIFLFQINKKKKSLIGFNILGIIFVIYLVFNPLRTYITGNTWGRQPSGEEFEGMNVYLAGSYFLGRILPSKLASKKRVTPIRSLDLKKKNNSKLKHNIIFILGESLTPNHMSLFNYKRDTTPLLKKFTEDERFYFSRATSSGVSSDVAVAFLMNSTFGDQGGSDVFKGTNCIFKLARESSFTTIYRSSQSNQQLRYIKNSLCPKFIESYKDLEMIDSEITDLNAASDQVLLDELETIDLNSEKNMMILLHQRGSHSPYSKRFESKNEKFKSRSDLGRRDKNLNHYDNSVVEFDFFMNRLLSFVRNQKKVTHVIYVSDHGEGLGESGVYGHGKLNQVSADVPFIYYSNNLDAAKMIINKIPKNMTHFNISLLISDLLGFKGRHHFSTPLKEYEVYGNDIDGFMGKLKMNFNSEK